MANAGQGFSSDLTKIYTHWNWGNVGSEDPMKAKAGRHVRGRAQNPWVAESYVAELPEVNTAVHKVAASMAHFAQGVLDAAHGHDSRSSHPRIELHQGDRTDWHVLLVVGPTGAGHSLDGQTNADKWSDADLDAMGAALSIEFGRQEYKDSKGRRQNAWNGLAPLHRAMAAVGAI